MTAAISAEAVVPCRAERARARLDGVLGRGERGSVPIRVGPRRRRWPTARVRAGLTVHGTVGRTLLSALHWEPVGPFQRFYPTLDAGIAVTAIDDTSCLLTVLGDYEPPLGRVGALADRALLHRIAASTAQDFTDRLARALARDAGSTDSEEGMP